MSTSPGKGLERVEREILGEKAAALGRAGERLEEALAELTSLAQHRVVDHQYPEPPRRA